MRVVNMFMRNARAHRQHFEAVNDVIEIEPATLQCEQSADALCSILRAGAQWIDWMRGMGTQVCNSHIRHKTRFVLEKS